MGARRWTEQDRDKVIRMTTAGASRQEIAKKLRTSVSSLRRHFGDVLNHEPGIRPTEFTETERASAIAMASYGIPKIEIARVLGVSLNTLKRRIGVDLNAAPTRANASVARALYRNATRGDGDVKAQVFWLKSRAGWTDRLAIDARVGGTVTHDHVVNFEMPSLLRQLSPEARSALRIVLTEVRQLQAAHAAAIPEDERVLGRDGDDPLDADTAIDAAYEEIAEIS